MSENLVVKTARQADLVTAIETLDAGVETQVVQNAQMLTAARIPRRSACRRRRGFLTRETTC